MALNANKKMWSNVRTPRALSLLLNAIHHFIAFHSYSAENGSDYAPKGQQWIALSKKSLQ